MIGAATATDDARLASCSGVEAMSTAEVTCSRWRRAMTASE